MRRPLCLTLLLLALSGMSSRSAIAQAPQSALSAEEQTLKNAGQPVTGMALVEFFRERSQPTVDPGKLQVLVRQLADKSPQTRELAAANLVRIGTPAIPWLRRAANELDESQSAARARQCLGVIEGESGAAVITAAARVVAQARPEGAPAALLAYLPFTPQEQATEEVAKALQAVALRDGKLDPALLDALKDPMPLRRAVAGEALVRLGGPGERALVRTLLEDPKPSVRLRLALALAEAHDPDAVNVLIGVLGELPPTQARPVEDFLNRLAGEWAVRAPEGDDTISRKLRREAWAAWWRTLEGSVVLEEFRKRSLTDAEREQAEALLRRLGDPATDVRERAMRDLMALGPRVGPLLRRAASGTDANIGELARHCLELLQERGLPPGLPSAAARLLALRRPPGSVEALLAYVTQVEDDSQVVEIQSALSVVGVREGKVEPALVRALNDSQPLRRTVAAEAICQCGLPESHALVRPLLQDADPGVRLRAGLALAAAQDREAFPVLIALLVALPLEQGVQIEEYLQRVAGAQGPTLALGPAPAEREKCRDAWSAWWRDKGSHAELPRLDSTTRLLGYTLIVDMYDPLKRSGRVFEVDAAGKTRWSIEGLQGPIDAQVLPGDHVLIVEQNTQHVSERDLKGRILWERTLPMQVLTAQRLPGGRTFIATRGQLLEVDHAGKEVFSHNRPNQDVMAAQRLKDGQYALVTYSWQYVRLDAAGKEKKTARLGSFPFTVNQPSIDFLPSDRLLVAEYAAGKVVELDLAGKVLWESSVPGPMSVSRLPNGHTLVGSNNHRRVTELDRAGKVVWEYKEGARPWRAKRR